MAEALLLAISKIGTVLGDEIIDAVIAELSAKVTKLRDLPENIKYIGRELRMMNSVIEGFDTTNLGINVVHQWIAELCNLSFHVEDVMDKYSYHAFHLREEKSFHKVYRGAHYATVFSELADEVVKIKCEIEQVKKLLKDYFHDNLLLPRSRIATDQRVSQGCLPELVQDDDLVGIKVNQSNMIGWLNSNAPDSSVITVSGMGGLGKTTLVLNVYDREMTNFPVHAWITVSKSYTIDALLRKLLKEIDKEIPLTEIDKMNAITLRQEIRKKLEGGKKCMVVLDDVWDREVYLKMEDIFKNLKASHVIITTRNDDVASLASSTERHLQLQPLNSDDAFNLFGRRAFSNRIDKKCPPELKNVADSIVNKCKGLPLAIISMGSLMSTKKPIEHAWNQVYNQFQSELLNTGDVQAILNLSYNDLPGNIRNCFLYCSLFPEDYIMSRETLVRQWVAEGFVVANQHNKLEDVAELNLMKLITRNMLQVVDYDEVGRVSTCKMHDIVRDLALTAAKDEKFGSANDQGAMIQIDKEVRRLSLYGWNDSDTSMVTFPCLRTLLLLEGVMSTQMWKSILSKSSYLTVLELQDSEITEVPASIGDLFNLRYVGLRRTRVKSLPETIEKLSNLQSLDIKQTRIEKLPRSIVKVKKLRHLFADRIIDEKQEDFKYFIGVQPPKDLSNLIELLTLETVEASDDLAAQLDKLRKLQSLWISNVSAMHSPKLFAALSKMLLLSSLLLNASDEEQTLRLDDLNPQSKHLHRLIIRGCLAPGTLECSIFHSYGRNLKYLALSWSGLLEDPLQMLALHVPNLTYLSLNKVTSAENLAISEDCFPQLKTLVMKNILNVNQLTIGDRALPNIECLYIVALPKLDKVPCGIESLSSLKKLCLLNLHKNFITQWFRNGMDKKMSDVLELHI
ncbi:hypothetical protein SEVIR_1G125600v4 [Setaria viridis]|uniref:NB-ARC domain-containing protein n=1 Tax=Setaria viridis TaxID=4556 RepID=A0A4U6WAF1_SETVI|nr:disease resistance protein RPM1-like [Setaria viridis]XP_034576061.1 disease resistance protein RPM1-like [Setaria viridis]XP_034576138.1 disease resistance protein RPM1-like [Setaria viridis]XP_034576207.1 disease resistance protein RPM1-like [Setaria viridis]XP_034576280.1 disease resistance protein RPM1-like [Setaria viridis]XP_034576353.1 disease resistance protein RPM1-like [Setaria viridis]XP_034576421.1 disease resistance protein RPM1-like [Setaria viridis]XP_034576495.1 disease re